MRVDETTTERAVRLAWILSEVQVRKSAGVRPPHRSVTREQVQEAEAAFAALFRKYVRYVASIARRLLGPGPDLDDVTQEVFFAASRGFGKVRSTEAVRPWLATVARRTAHRRLCAVRAQRELSASVSDAASAIVCHDFAPDRDQRVTALYRVLRSLPHEQSIPWVLRYIEGETLEEMAATLALSVSTVQRRLRVAERNVQRGLSPLLG
jgi:RNA polymerase sigma-70 factor (ECF subfamily)